MKKSYRENLNSQSRRFLNHHYYGIGSSKQDNPNSLRSFRTLNEHARIIAAAAEEMKVHRLKHITPDMAQDYLQSKKNENVCAKYLTGIKQALERLVFQKEPHRHLSLPKALPPKSKPLSESNRAYTKTQVDMIIKRQSERHSLSTQIAHAAGLRAAELFMIRRTDEETVTSTRIWREDLFSGLEGVRYIVEGKGALRREVLIPFALASKLEALRLESPKKVKDRGINYSTYYDIPGGSKFSKSFTVASQKSLGWSKGAHGLRFSYAQKRIDYDISACPYSETKLRVSQEMGHFRPDITDRYLKI
ncbi:MAG: integrase domain-containing protein [Oleispira sp.]|nr:integrase domain-containing protein [Oleispira sp.]